MVNSAQEYYDSVLLEVKKESLLFVKSMFEAPEQLKNIELILNKEIRTCQESETKLQSILADHVENLKSSIQELNSANLEASILESNMNEVRSTCDDFKKLEGGLEKLIKFSKTVSSNSQSISLLNQLLNLNETIQTTGKLIEEMNLLQAHKNIRDIETIRDKIFSKHLDSLYSSGDPTQTIDKWPVSKNFEQVAILNKKLFEQIINVFKNLFKYASDDPTTLVSAIRIVKREEAVDEYWKKARNAKQSNETIYIPNDRPKGWIEHLEPIIISNIKENLSNLKNDLDFTSNKHAVTEYLSRITKSVQSTLLTVQDSIISAFPPNFNIIQIYMLNYHNLIVEIVQNFINSFGEDARGTDIIGILMFERDYYGDELYSCPKFNPPLLNIIRKYVPILDPKDKSKIEKLYVSRVYNLLDGKVDRMIKLEVQTWTGNQPPIVIDHQYFTLTYTFYNDFVGVHLSGFNNNSLSSELHWGVFKSCLTAFETFTNKYADSFDEYAFSNFPPAQNLSLSTNALSTLTSYLTPDRGTTQQKQHPEPNPYFAQFCMAVANNTKEICNSLTKACDQFVSDLKKREDIFDAKNKDNDEILGENIKNRILAIRSTLNEVIEKCTKYICNDFIKELTPAFEELFSKNWRQRAEEWSGGLHGAVEGFVDSINQLNENYRIGVLKMIDMQLSLQYLSSFFRQNNKYVYEDAHRYGDIMYNDGVLLDAKFSNLLKIDTKGTWCYALAYVATVFKSSDQTFATIDMFNLFKVYGDFTNDHAYTLLRLRSDMSKDIINQIITDSTANIDNKGQRKYGLFTNLRVSSHDKKLLNLPL